MAAEAVEALEAELRADSRLTLVGFLTRSCEPCRELRPQLLRLGSERAELCRVILVDIEDRPEVIARFGVTAFPTVVCFRNGEEIYRFRGGALPPSVLSRLS
jgi:thioredoxin-like negative regulator of GroEL